MRSGDSNIRSCRFLFYSSFEVLERGGRSSRPETLFRWLSRYVSRTKIYLFRKHERRFGSGRRYVPIGRFSVRWEWFTLLKSLIINDCLLLRCAHWTGFGPLGTAVRAGGVSIGRDSGFGNICESGGGGCLYGALLASWHRILPLSW